MTAETERDLGVARAAMAGTRHDLGMRLERAATLGAPSRLLTVSAAAVRETAIEKAWQLGHRALGVAATRGRQPGVLGGLAAMAPIVFLLLRRRRRRRVESTRTGSVLRLLESPVVSALLSAATVLLRRR